MSLSVMLQQLAGGMVVSVEIFVVTLVFSLPLGLLICFGRMSKNPVIMGNRVSIHFHYAWNTSDAAADGCIFRTIFYFRYPAFPWDTA